MGLRITSADDAQPVERTQTLSLCMIMKDEEEHLVRCLDSVQGVVDEIVIVDTGSTDSSIEIAERYGAKIIHEPWIHDFAHHRNTGIDAATSDWILVMDADEELVNGAALRPLLEDTLMDGYSLREVNYVGEHAGLDAVVNAAFRVFRNKPTHRYSGALHEQVYAAVDPTRERSRFIAVELLHYGYLNDATVSKNKKERNMRLALAEVRRHPDDAFVLFNAGVEFQRAFKPAMAIEYFGRAFKALPDMRMNFASLLLRNLSACLLDTEQYDEALDVLRDAIEAYPGYTDLVYLEGQVYSNRNQYRAAIASFRRAIELGDHDGEEYIAQWGMGSFIGWHALGSIHHQMGDVRRAVACYRKAVTTSPSYFSPPFVALAKIVLSGSDPDEAVNVMRSLMPEKRRVDALHGAAEVLQTEGHPAHALVLLDEAIGLEPTLHGARVARAQCLAALGRFDEALATLDEIPATSDTYGPAAARRCLVGVAAGDAAAVDAGIAVGEELAGSSWAAAWRLARDARAGVTGAMPKGVDAAKVSFILLDMCRALLQMKALDAVNDVVPVLLAHAADRPAVDEALGLAFYEVDFADPALQCLVSAAGADGFELSTAAFEALARLCVAKDFREDAETFFRAALDSDAENQSRYVDLATFMGQDGRYAEAADVLNDGLREWPHSTMLRELGESLQMMADATATK